VQWCVSLCAKLWLRALCTLSRFVHIVSVRKLDAFVHCTPLVIVCALCVFVMTCVHTAHVCIYITEADAILCSLLLLSALAAVHDGDCIRAGVSLQARLEVR
jgi:hypothetical protein